MLSCTTTTVATFLHPFVIAGDTDELPAGEYGVLEDEDAMLGNSIAAYRRTATFLLNNWHAGKSDLHAVALSDLDLALAQDRADANKH
ncbi:hypothetical protein ASD8599_01768 [Ascidiaceihabitans donghaensis]|uniref:Uncharacterized protein n=1 Tax=Ascidiaceihabitans donghaensis TaxID=1510460 RepID=A0A2R8BD76_9RHOB|nr:hypothetical protein [Ascidiaceihabitans donghaensis]SPH21027.1 hypothetical protein ASD8599_01768 [Ascidiaceihabitans donghaensis]